MAYIDLTFNTTSLNNNISMRVGDTVYYTNPTESSGFNVSSDKVLIGDIETIENSSTTTAIKVNCEIDLTLPTADSFIFFSKNNVVNMSSVRGYFGLVELKNNSTSAMELFSVGCDISESSK